MSRQDADDESSTTEGSTPEQEQRETTSDSRTDSDGEEATEGGQEETPKAEETPLEEIAEKPDDDVEAVLADIFGGLEAAGGEPTEEDVDDDLLEAVESQSATELARVISRLRTERDELATELEAERERADDFESRLKRKQADFQNYKKRQKERMEEEKQRATEDLVERLLDVRDNLARALEQDESVDIRDGVESTLDQFDSELERENVAVIEPEPGMEVDPQRHEVLIRIESGQPADAVAELHRPGYEMAGKVIRPAQVAVSEGSAEGDDADEGAAE